MNKIVGKNIKSFRVQRGLSRRKAAQLTGISPAYWSYLERGEKNPSINLINRIASVLGVDVHLLFINSTDKKIPVELLHQLYLIQDMGPKHVEFVLEGLKLYNKIHRNN